MQTTQSRPSASTPPSFLPSSHDPPHALTIDPRAAVSLRGSAILTPPPSAHPRQLSHTPALTHAHMPGHVSPGPSQIQPQPLPAPRVLNPLQHVSSANPQHQLQQQLALHAENGILHARIAPPPPPPQVTGLSAPGLKPPTLQQERQQTMTHSTTTVLAPTAVPLRPNQDQSQRRLSSFVQLIDAARLHGPQQAQLPAPPQAPMRGQQPQPAVTTLPSAPEMHTRPQRALLPHTPASERSHTLPPSTSAPSSSSSSTQSQSQSQAQQLMHQERYAPATIAAFNVLQPAKALLEQSWTTAIAAVQHELAAVHSEHVRAMREQQRLSEQLKRAQVERAQANRALLGMQARLGESLATIQVERKARSQLEHMLAEMSKECTCGTVAAKLTPVPSLPPHLPSSTTLSPLSSSPAATVSKPASVDSEVYAAQTPPVSPTMTSLPPADQRRELRREREEESVEGEGPSKRRRITPSLMSEPSAVSAKPASVLEAASTPENAETQKATEAVVSSDKQVAQQLQSVQQQSSPPPESAPDEPRCELTQGQSEEEPSVADADTAPTRHKIGTEHIQLVYETIGQTLQCRMCMLRKRELDEDMQVATYPAEATYDELIGHCEQEHDAALNALASMTPADIAEMQQLMLASS